MVAEHVTRWTGGRIGLGATVIHFNGTSSPSTAEAAANLIQTFFGAIRPVLPIGVTTLGDPEVKILSTAGVLTDVIPISGRTGQGGQQSGTWTNGVGAMIRWNTASVVGGRRLLGRTFLVPLGSAQFSGGDVTGGARTQIQTAADTLRTAMASNGTPLCVWSKAGQVTSEVISGVVPARPATLRSRNDRD